MSKVRRQNSSASTTPTPPTPHSNPFPHSGSVVLVRAFNGGGDGEHIYLSFPPFVRKFQRTVPREENDRTSATSSPFPLPLSRPHDNLLPLARLPLCRGLVSPDSSLSPVWRWCLCSAERAPVIIIILVVLSSEPKGFSASLEGPDPKPNPVIAPTAVYGATGACKTLRFRRALRGKSHRAQ